MINNTTDRHARKNTSHLALSEALTAAAWLHDIGYAPDLAKTGFHPLDGARYLARIDAPERIVSLIARHSYAVLEAELRGLGYPVAAFPDECGTLRDALWCCDLTTSRTGSQSKLATASRSDGWPGTRPTKACPVDLGGSFRLGLPWRTPGCGVSGITSR